MNKCGACDFLVGKNCMSATNDICIDCVQRRKWLITQAEEAERTRIANEIHAAHDDGAADALEMDADALEVCLMGMHEYNPNECHEECPYNTDKWIECGDCGHDHHPDYCEGEDTD